MTEPAKQPLPAAVAAECPRCRYSLTGLALGSLCPECGASPYAGLEGATLTDDRPCLQCGYSLKGLKISGVCPECGREVIRSLQGNLLVHSSSAFVRRLVGGATLVLWGLVLYCVSLLMSVIGFNSGLRNGSALMDLFGYAGILTPVASAACSLTGWWLLTSPDPALIGADRSTSARKVLRVTLIVSAIALATVTLVQLTAGRSSIWQYLMAVRRSGQAGAADVIGGLAVFANAAAWPVKTIASLKYVRAIALRIPRLALANRARGLITFAAVGAVLLLVCIAVPLIASEAGVHGSAFGPLLIIPVCGGFIGVIVWSCIYATLVGGLRAELARVARRI